VSIPLSPLALRTNAERELRQWQEAHKDVHSECVIAFGNPGHEIVQMATEIKPQLIVLGTHGRTGLGRLVMGSVAEKVMRHSPGPVLALKRTDAQLTVKYDDWISIAMSEPEPSGERTAKTRDLPICRTASAGYGATVEHTLRTTNRWLGDIRLRLGEEGAPHTFRLLRAVLHVLRDHLPVNHVASLAAQLPLLLRGVFYEGWDPGGKPDKRRHGVDFVEQVKARIAPDSLDHPEWAIRAILTALGDHLTPGEVSKLQRALPQIGELWQANRPASKQPRHQLV
jgi:uncharacterized protein (DUF2267 family)